MPVLAYPDFAREFYLYTHALGIGLDAALMQKDDKSKLHVVGYVSKVLKKAEHNSSTTHKEALTVV